MCQGGEPVNKVMYEQDLNRAMWYKSGSPIVRMYFSFRNFRLPCASHSSENTVKDK